MSRARSDDNSALSRLAAALHPVDPHPDRVLAASDAGTLEVVSLARAHRVSGLLSRSLETGGRLEALPAAARAALRQDVLEAEFHRAGLSTDLAAAASALDREGLPFLALKGAALGGLVYPAPHLRPRTDVDILVRPTDVQRALAALGRAGFEAPTAADQAFWREVYFNLPLASPRGRGATLEIHWSLSHSARHQPDVDGLFARARFFDLDGRRVGALGAADLLLHQALHHSYHYFEPKLIWIYDLALLHRAGPPSAEVVDRARAWGMSATLALSVHQVEKAFPGAAQPALLDFARRSRRAQGIRALFGARGPVELIAGWDRRWRQLLLAAATLDRPGAALTATASWLRRTIRYGDRAGHRRRGPGEAAR